MNPANDQSTKSYFTNAIGLLLLVFLLYALYNVLSAFFGVFSFAIIFAVSFASLFEAMVKRLGNKRKLAGFVYGIFLVGIIAVPFGFLVDWLAGAIHDLRQFMMNIEHAKIPSMPENVASIPVIGPKVAAFWAQLQADPKATVSAYQPQILEFSQHLLQSGAGIAGTTLELIVGIIISAVVLTGGAAGLKPLKAVLSQLAGEQRADSIIDSSGKAIKGVAIGVMGTAFIEALAMWIGLKIAGVPMGTLLTAVTFLLAVVQLGPLLVAIPVTIWLAGQGQTGYAIFMGVWIVVLFVIDNVVKPILIGKSGKLPILVLFLGVIGGMTQWGFTGMFKGAIILAVAYSLFQSWFENKAQESVTASAKAAG
jgi:predicted PurR-regulated permease PerM